MGVFIWSKRPARIVQSHGDGTYEVEYLGDVETATRIDRNDLDPMNPLERERYLPAPRLEPDRDATGEAQRPPLRKLMDELPCSRAQMIKLLGFSPPKVDRLIGERYLPLDVAVLVATVFDVEVDPEVLPEAERPHLSGALAAAREGAAEVA
jgi:hypothetical protein